MIQPNRATRRRLARLVGAGVIGALGVGMIPGTAGATPPEPPAPRDTAAFCANVPSNFDPFVDDNGDTFEAQIECLALSGITTGGPGGRPANQFGPGLNVARDQMASFIARLADTANSLEITNLQALPAYDGTNDFPDVPMANVHLQSINRLSQAGIVQGGPGGRPANQYGPSLLVTRGQMASFINRTQGFLTGTPFTSTMNFFLDDENSVHQANINGIASQGIYVGDGVDAAFPDQPITRGQMSALLIRTLAANQATGAIRPLPAAAGATVTTRPELASATIVSTTTASQVTPTNTIGTRVRFTFDEPVGSFVPNAAEFFVRTASGLTPTAATDVTVEANGTSVIARFAGLDTASAAAALVLATVDDGAVTDNQGQVNPEGDAAIGSGSSSTTGGTSGTTDAPDVQSLGGFRQAVAANDRAVDFVFDEPAFVVNTTGFSLVGVDGNVSTCTGPPVGSTNTTNPGAGTTPGGNGTATITVVCQALPTAPTATPVSTTNIARGVVQTSTVNDGVVANDNPAQIAELGNTGNTVDPDLVSVTFTQGSGTGGSATNDSALFTFDQAVVQTGAGAPALGSFYFYDGTGTETAATGTATVNPGNPTQVLVQFASQSSAIDAAIGAGVDPGAVTGVSSGSSTNEQDEVGVGNTGVTTTTTPGRTNGPDLTTVALSRASDLFGNPGDFRAVYTFDEDVADIVVAASGNFHLLLADGTRLNASNCTTVTGTTNTAPGDQTVSCTAFVIDGGGTAATSTQVGSAVAGTVDTTAVVEETAGSGGAQTNPEGYEVTTGGTGTSTRSRA